MPKEYKEGNLYCSYFPQPSHQIVTDLFGVDESPEIGATSEGPLWFSGLLTTLPMKIYLKCSGTFSSSFHINPKCLFNTMQVQDLNNLGWDSSNTLKGYIALYYAPGK